MINDSLIAQKISELVLEAQTGVKRPTTPDVPLTTQDSVTISDNAAAMQKLATTTNNGQDTGRAANIESVKEHVVGETSELSEEVAEKIARRILGLAA
jgi:dihydroneopterin aldolase